MVNRIIDEINISLENGCYMAALSLALMLPDICAKAKFPNEKSNKKRYVDWYDEYIGQYEIAPDQDEENQMPYLSGEVVYSLRNSVLHQGTPNIADGKGNINKFVLVVQRPNGFKIYADTSAIITHNGDIANAIREYRVNIGRICLIITATAKKFYSDNKEKFNFFNYTVIDMDKETEMLRRLGFLKMVEPLIEEIDYGNK